MENKTIKKPPVVVVLGHIDHGKTSLLLAIRKLQFTSEKPGGVITQHIGAYQVEVDKSTSPPFADAREVEVGNPPSPKATEGQGKITFLDTPGHEAFSQMRSRGAKVADIAVLVIDAGEGIHEQTKEAILHIKKSRLPFIVALNKIDKPDADPEKVERELVKEDVLVELMGGKVPAVEVSAKTGQGIPELLEVISLVAEMEGLKADPEKSGEGVVIESYLDNQRGPTATLLLTQGHLKIGDIIGTPSAFVKIKNLEDFQKKPMEKVLPSDPVLIFGFNQVPKVGEEFKVFSDIESAQKNIQVSEKPVLEPAEDLEGKKVFNLILKADVLGSLEAVESILKNLPQDKVALRILKSDVGNINESDLKLAKGNKVLILGFRVKADPSAQKIAEREKIRITTFEIIYELVEGVRKLMEKIVEPEETRQDLGKIKVLAIFLAEKNRQIVGGRVIEGEIQKGALIEVFRNEEKVGFGKMINLQRNKKDIDKVIRGEECGVLFEGDVKIQDGDILAIYTEERRKGEL